VRRPLAAGYAIGEGWPAHENAAAARIACRTRTRPISMASRVNFANSGASLLTFVLALLFLPIDVGAVRELRESVRDYAVGAAVHAGALATLWHGAGGTLTSTARWGW